MEPFGENNVKVLFTISMLIPIVSCKGNSFQSGGANANRPRTETINLVCGTNEGVSAAPNFRGIGGTSVRVSGELCSVREQSVSSEPISLIFVIDYSGSMAQADPELGGTCGRMRAAAAIVDKMNKDSNGQGNIQAALVHFHLTAETRIQPTSLRNFATQVSASSFCGFQEARGTANTNYEAAFSQAKSVLAGAPGNKLVYFLTDGEPTAPIDVNAITNSAPGTDPRTLLEPAYAAGLRAAEDLRSSNQNLTLNVIYLDASGSTFGNINSIVGNTQVRDPKTYLEQIAGRPDRVRIVRDADSLAAQITTFEVPAVTSLDSSAIFGELTAPGYGSRPVELESLVPAPGRQGVWIFTTKPLQLFGVTGQQTENRLILKSRSQKIPETTGVVIFQQVE
jgi:hypothetical protein